jgi:energy-coupling factor transporter ATP-binding protein EcfA2
MGVDDAAVGDQATTLEPDDPGPDRDTARSLHWEFAGTTRFAVLRCLGHGGAGTVYEVLDRARAVRVALKLLHTASPQGLLRFKREFRKLQDLHHPNLILLGELMEEDGQWFFTMELVEGVDFLSYVCSGTAREGCRLDEVRLRDALRQLAEGLVFLHAAGYVHRDIKPANVLVTPAGRVVILDFGLVADVRSHGTLTDHGVVGTIDYMAPEQAALGPVDPPADWYSVGVMLYEALTGHRPFHGSPVEVLSRKQEEMPLPPHLLEPRVPLELDVLCMELLSTEPTLRPDDDEVLQWLEETAWASTVAGSVPSRPALPSFVGRAAELGVLRGLFAKTRAGGAELVLVRGESGVGKTALVRHFAEILAREVPGLVLLAGRCYERESVPYKGIDGIIDALSIYLQKLPVVEAAALLPRKAAVLAQVFPVLRRSEAFAHTPPLRDEVFEPKKLRAASFAAVRELLARLCERHPLLLVIDDIQWADADSLALLGEVFRKPDEPALLLLATQRQDKTRGHAMEGTVLDHGRVLDLDGLPPEEARQLTLVMAEPLHLLTAADADRIAHETGGHPLFIHELVQHAWRLGPQSLASHGPLQLEEALGARIGALESELRQVLELVAVAGLPVSEELIAAAAGMDVARVERASALLRGQHLLRIARSNGHETLEPYHDRIREAVLAALAAPALGEAHRRLAVALEAEGAGDSEELASHWQGAGDTGRSLLYVECAAQGAVAALAFDRAARLYRQALAWMPPDPQARRRLQVKLGHALANAGCGPGAAEAYLAAAAMSDDAGERLDLQRRAGDQLMRCGYFERGAAVLRDIMASVGVKLPSARWRTLASIVWRRSLLELSGLHYEIHEERALRPEELLRCDVCYSTICGFFFVDPICAAELAGRYLRFALRAGEPSRIIRGLVTESIVNAQVNATGRRRAKRWLALAESLVTAFPYPQASGALLHGAAAIAYHEGRWRDCRILTERTEEAYRRDPSTLMFEINFTIVLLLAALGRLGELDVMARRVPQALREANEHGDLFFSTYMSFALAKVQMAQNDERAERTIDEALKRWPRTDFDFTQFVALQMQLELDLYRGGDAAWRRLMACHSSLSRSLLLRLQSYRVILVEQRALAALAAAVVAAPSERKHLLARVARDARRIGREGLPHSLAFKQLLGASVALLDGDEETAVAGFEAAEAGFEAADMGLLAAAARRRRGELLGSAGRMLTMDADRRMVERGVVCPERMAAALAPVGAF